MDQLSPIAQAIVPGGQRADQAEGLQKRLTAAEELAIREKAQEYWKVAEGFEELFLNMMMSAMRKTQLESGLMGESHETQMYRSLFDEQVAAEISKRHDFGLGTQIFDWLTRNHPELRKFSGSNADAVRAYRANQ